MVRLSLEEPVCVHLVAHCSLHIKGPKLRVCSTQDSFGLRGEKPTRVKREPSIRRLGLMYVPRHVWSRELVGACCMAHGTQLGVV